MSVLRFSCKHPSCESFLSPEKHFSLRLTCSLFRDSGFVSDVEGFPVSPSLLSTFSCLDAHLPQLNRKIDTKRHSNNPPQFKACVCTILTVSRNLKISQRGKLLTLRSHRQCTSSGQPEWSSAVGGRLEVPETLKDFSCNFPSVLLQFSKLFLQFKGCV